MAERVCLNGATLTELAQEIRACNIQPGQSITLGICQGCGVWFRVDAQQRNCSTNCKLKAYRSRKARRALNKTPEARRG